MSRTATMIIALSFTVPLLVNAGNVVFTPGALGQVSVPVKSFLEIRFEEVVRQAYDFSCGSAAVATLLTYHYELPKTEEAVFTAMYENGDQEKIRSKGFSLLDMKLFLESMGYKADGFRIPVDKLIAVDIAAIALINVRGYSHFVVVKAADSDRVLVSDPAVGNRVLNRREFEEMWNGIFLLIHSDMSVAHAAFNEDDAWAGHPPPPFGDALSRSSLAQFSMIISDAGDY